MKAQPQSQYICHGTHLPFSYSFILACIFHYFSFFSLSLSLSFIFRILLGRWEKQQQQRNRRKPQRRYSEKRQPVFHAASSSSTFLFASGVLPFEPCQPILFYLQRALLLSSFPFTFPTPFQPVLLPARPTAYPRGTYAPCLPKKNVSRGACEFKGTRYVVRGR